jgi:hypothetical protein
MIRSVMCGGRGKCLSYVPSRRLAIDLRFQLGDKDSYLYKNDRLQRPS